LYFSDVGDETLKRPLRMTQQRKKMRIESQCEATSLSAISVLQEATWPSMHDTNKLPTAVFKQVVPTKFVILASANVQAWGAVASLTFFHPKRWSSLSLL
jgi:hypothetical protein